MLERVQKGQMHVLQSGYLQVHPALEANMAAAYD